MEQKGDNLKDYATIRFLDPKIVKFTLENGGFLSMSIKPDETYTRVNLHRMFPFTVERGYISVRTVEGKEIGVIKSIDDFPKETVKLIEIELERRYFTPVIEKINSIREEFGYYYWDTMTSAGPRRFTVRREAQSVITINNRRILIVDVDGNRFEIPDYKAVEPRYFKIIEALL